MPGADDHNDKRRRAREMTELADQATAESLLAADAAVTAAQVALDDARAKRAEVIARAIDDDGWTLARIGQVLSVTRQRVGQLRRGE